MIIEKFIELKGSSRNAVVSNGQVFSYADFYNQLVSTVNYFSKFKISENQNLCVILVQNSHICWLTLIAMRYLGFNTIHIDDVDQIEKLELKNIAHIIILESERIFRKNLQSQPDSLSSKYRIIPDTIFFPGNNRIGELSTTEDLTHQSGHIIYTSGTTGKYKKILMTPALEAARIARGTVPDIFNSDTVYHNLFFPAFTAAGHIMPLAIWSRGASVIFCRNDNFLSDLYHQNATIVFLTPYYIPQLLETFQRNDFNKVPHLTIISGGGFLSSDLAKRVIERVTPNLKIVYGSSETTALMYSTFANDEDLIWLQPRFEDHYKILNDAGEECGVDEEGVLATKMRDTDSFEYFEDPETTAEFFHDGYFFPGDLAVKRADGRIRILGRVTDVLNIQGDKFSVAPFEKAIEKFIQASTVCIFSTFTVNGKNRVIVAIEAATNPTIEQISEIQKFLNRFDELAINVLPEFPRTQTAMRKIDRKALRSLLKI